MHGVLIVNCKFCAKQAGLYILENYLGYDEQNVDMAELQDQIDMKIGRGNIKIIDTRYRLFYVLMW